MKPLTTGQIAKACGVAPRTVTKWIDRGLLPGFRLPGSQDRRVLEEDLQRFLEKNKMMPRRQNRKLLCIGVDTNTVDTLVVRFVLCNIESVQSVFQAGVIFEKSKPDCVIIDSAIGRLDTLQVVSNLDSVDVIILLRDLDEQSQYILHKNVYFQLHDLNDLVVKITEVFTK